MRNNPTIRDAAKAAGVSVATVSRVLNDKLDVAEETRQKVLKTINEIGYVKRTQWQQLTSGKTRIISLHYPRKATTEDQLSHDFFIGASAACEEQGYSLHLITQSLDENRLLELYQAQQSDGIILMEVRLTDWRVDFLRKNQLPFVMIGRCKANERWSFFDLDTDTAVAMAIDPLVSVGQERIVFISILPAPRRKQYGPTIRAADGYQNACKRHKLSPIYCEANNEIYTISEAVSNLLDAHPETTAIVGATDMAAIGIYDAIRTRGLQIPEDISVVGCTNDQYAGLFTPSLTAIEFPSWMMGYEAGKLLIEKLENSAADVVQNLLEPKLVVRNSSGLARTVSSPE